MYCFKLVSSKNYHRNSDWTEIVEFYFTIVFITNIKLQQNIFFIPALCNTWPWPNAFWCCANVADGGPALIQHWVSVSCWSNVSGCSGGVNPHTHAGISNYNLIFVKKVSCLYNSLWGRILMVDDICRVTMITITSHCHGIPTWRTPSRPGVCIRCTYVMCMLDHVTILCVHNVL